MKKCFSVLTLLLTVCGLAACQEGVSSSSLSGSPEPPSSSTISSLQSNSSLPNMNGYIPIVPASMTDKYIEDYVSNFSLSTTKISEDQAKESVDNDISKYPEEKSLHKKTKVTSKKSESHVSVNRSNSTYSPKNIYEERTILDQFDSDNKWSYRKIIDYLKVDYFVEDTLIHHRIREVLDCVKDGCYYQVIAEQSYYEGMENRGTFESYYYKGDDLSEGSHSFDINVPNYTFFNANHGFDEINKSIYENFAASSSFYTAEYREMVRHPAYEYHSSGKEGNFGCVASDDYTYDSSTLTDCPSGEKGIINKIVYHQDYMLEISDYFNFHEDYMTTSVSKNASGVVIRDEESHGRYKMVEECETYFPDLSKFEEREDTKIIM